MHPFRENGALNFPGKDKTMVWLNFEGQLTSEQAEILKIEISVYPVSTKVNSPKNDNPEIIAPMATDQFFFDPA